MRRAAHRGRLAALLLPCTLLPAAPTQAESLPPVVVDYGYHDGSLPPPDSESFRMVITADHLTTLTACRGYEAVGCVSLLAPASDLALLAPAPPIGGAQRRGRVTWDAEVTLPARPAPADAARVGAVPDAVHAAIPEPGFAEVNAAADARAGGG